MRRVQRHRLIFHAILAAGLVGVVLQRTGVAPGVGKWIAVGSLTVLVLLAMAGFVMVHLLSSRRQE